MSRGTLADLDPGSSTLRPFAKAGSPAGVRGEDDFDSLADLFLGEVGAAASNTGPSLVDAGALAPIARPQLRLTSDEEVEVMRPAALVANTTERPVPSVPSTALVECVLLGHLPVLAAAWASQYIRDVATAAQRPVAVLRIQAGYATIELVLPKMGGGSLPWSATLAGASFDRQSCGTLEEAVRSAAAVTNRWIVRVDSSDEIETAAGPLVRVVTLLTGADEAARVGAYRTLKSLSQRLPAVDRARASESAETIIRLAVMSAPSERATDVGRRLAEAAKSFLGREVELASCTPAISSSQAPVLLFSGRTDVQTGAVMDVLGRALTQTAARPVLVLARPPVAVPASPTFAAVVTAKPEPAVARTTAQTARVGETDETDGTDGTDMALGRLMDVETVRPPVASRPSTTPQASPMTRADRGVEKTEQTKPDEARECAPEDELPTGSLAMHLPELRPISLRCPYAPGVEFAVDGAGTLHMLNLVASDAAAEGAVSELLVGAAWADAHAELLGARAGGGGRVMHLFTDRPRDSRRLQETNIRVHLLARVSVEQRMGWYCADLN